jgi:hypothetical protein
MLALQIDNPILVLTRNEESQVTVAQHSGDTDQTRTTTRHNAHILPCVLALPPPAMVLIVQFRDCLSQGSDTSSWTIFSAMSGDVDLAWPLEASLYAVVDFRRTLSQVCPFFGLLEETVLEEVSEFILNVLLQRYSCLIGLLARPHHSGGCTSGVETSVWLVSFVRGSELSVNA